MCWFLGVEVFNQPEQPTTSHGVKEKKTTWNKSEKKKLSHITKKEKTTMSEKGQIISIIPPTPTTNPKAKSNQTKGKGKGKGYFCQGHRYPKLLSELFALECKHPKKEGGEREKISILFPAKKRGRWKPFWTTQYCWIALCFLLWCMIKATKKVRVLTQELCVTNQSRILGRFSCLWIDQRPNVFHMFFRTKSDPMHPVCHDVLPTMWFTIDIDS